MSDSRRVHRAIKRTLTQLYPERPQGNLARHLDTLAGMVSGIVMSKSCQLPKMASTHRPTPLRGAGTWASAGRSSSG